MKFLIDSQGRRLTTHNGKEIIIGYLSYTPTAIPIQNTEIFRFNEPTKLYQIKVGPFTFKTRTYLEGDTLPMTNEEWEANANFVERVSGEDSN